MPAVTRFPCPLVGNCSPVSAAAPARAHGAGGAGGAAPRSSSAPRSRRRRARRSASCGRMDVPCWQTGGRRSRRASRALVRALTETASALSNWTGEASCSSSPASGRTGRTGRTGLWKWNTSLYPSDGPAFVQKLGNLSMTYYTNGFGADNVHAKKNGGPWAFVKNNERSDLRLFIHRGAETPQEVIL